MYENDNQKSVTKLTVVLLLFILMLSAFGWANRVDDTSINSQWSFSYYGSNAGAGAEAVPFDDSSWSIVDLPHTWNALDTQDGINNNYARGFGWYRKHYTIGSEYSGKRIYLFFEAVGKKASVYCNGTLVGNHLGGYAAFCYDITDQVNFGADNVIAVRADNANTSSVSSLNIIPRSGDFNQYGGICRKVHLIITDPIHITLLDYASPGIYLTPTNVSASSANLEVKALVRNAGAVNQSVTVRAKIYDANDTLLNTLETTTNVLANSTSDVIQNTTISNPHLWNGRIDPYLYKVITEVEVNSVVVDSVEQPLGFRYFSVDPNNGFSLNSHYLDLHGVAMHEDRADKGRAISDADRQQDIALMLEMGCTWIRLSHYQHAEKIYDLCDESGIVLSTEIPIVNSIDTSSTAFADNCKEQLRELIRQNYNHPSVFFWLLYNELTTSGSETLIGELNTLAHNEDSTRLTACAHNNTSDYAAWSYITDILAYNRYMGWYGGSPESFAPWADGIHAGRPTDSIGITEYGAGANAFQHETPPNYPGPSAPWHPEEYQSYYHEVYWKAMKARPWLWCKTVWNGFDFSVDSRNEGSQIELNDKGMVTRNRTIKKDTFYWYKANWTTEPMVYITSRRFTPRTTCPQYVKVYSNCETVELFINGRSLGTRTGENHIFMWDSTIHLNPGDNEIKAVGSSGGAECMDICNWEFVIENKYVVESVTASHYESGNPPENAIDDSLSTRWAGDSYPWIKFDLGQDQQVETIGIAFYLGSQRTYYFNIEASTDGQNWTPILTNGASSGMTTEIEKFNLDSTVTGRYFRINGQGNTGPYPQWSSYSEVVFYHNLSPDCAFMRSLNCGYDSDFSGPMGQPDCVVNNYDFAEIAAQWQDNYIETVTPTNPGTAHLVAYWSLDGNYNDATGNHNATVIGGSPSFVNPGHSGQSVDFDGASALNCANSTGIDLTSGATISAWIKSNSVSNDWACVVAKGITTWRLIRNSTGNTISFHFNPADGGTEYQANGVTDVLDNQWHHLMAVYDGSNNIYLYVDGQLDASASTGAKTLRTSSDPVYIGSRVGRLNDRSWDGQIDEVRIYDVALSDSELLWLSEGQTYTHIPDPPRPTDLVPDGQINMADLLVFVNWWFEGTY